MARGRFITFEGIEGVGKSTQIDRFVARLEQGGVTVLRTREPGGTPTAERIREVVLQHGDEPLPPVAELLLMFAARAVLVDNVIRPALDEGRWVVADRFVDASRAYQGGGREMPPQRVETLADWVLGDLAPDCTVLLDAPVDVGLERTRRRGAQDRLDSETEAFHQRVRAAYLALAEAEPARFRVVDAQGGIDEVGAAVDAIATELLAAAK